MIWKRNADLLILYKNNKKMAKRLTLSTSDKKIGGVCGGVAQYFDIDPLIVRIIWLVLLLCCGVGAVAYLLCWFLLPKE